jgi:hypothetical protein
MEITGIPYVVGPGELFTLNFAPYAPGTLPDRERFSGQADIDVRYGYPDGPYTRLMRRRLQFQVIVKPMLPPGMPGTLMPMGGVIPVPFGFREEDRD